MLEFAKLKYVKKFVEGFYGPYPKAQGIVMKLLQNFTIETLTDDITMLPGYKKINKEEELINYHKRKFTEEEKKIFDVMMKARAFVTEDGDDCHDIVEWWFKYDLLVAKIYRALYGADWTKYHAWMNKLDYIGAINRFTMYGLVETNSFEAQQYLVIPYLCEYSKLKFVVDCSDVYTDINHSLCISGKIGQKQIEEIGKIPYILVEICAVKELSSGRVNHSNFACQIFYTKIKPNNKFNYEKDDFFEDILKALKIAAIKEKPSIEWKLKELNEYAEKKIRIVKGVPCDVNEEEWFKKIEECDDKLQKF